MAFVEIGGSPTEEECAQTGHTRDYDVYNRLECRAYVPGLRIVYGPEPEGAGLRTKDNPHEFGTYYEVLLKYDPADEAQRAYADKVENGLATWDEAGQWPPVTYDDKGQAVHVLDKPETWSKTANPECLKVLPTPA
jgi:hypothetical protein